MLGVGVPGSLFFFFLSVGDCFAFIWRRGHWFWLLCGFFFVFGLLCQGEGFKRCGYLGGSRGHWFYGCCCVGGVLGCSALRYSGVGMFQVLVETFLVRGGDGFWLGGLVFRYTVGGDFSLISQGLEGGSPFPSHASE